MQFTFMKIVISNYFFSLLGSFHILVFALSGCGEVDRANPSDPVITQGTASFSLLAEFTELQKNDLTDRIIEIQYQVADLTTDVSVDGKMDLIGTTGRVRLNNIETATEKFIKIQAFDAGGILTFIGQDTLNFGDSFDDQQVAIKMERLRGSIELIAVFPTEVVQLEIFGGVDSDTLLGTFSMSGKLEQIVNDIPTGTNQPFLLKVTLF